MIKHFVKTSLQDSSKGTVKETIQTSKSLILKYPCSSSFNCTPYVLKLSAGVYKFECWGSKGEGWEYEDKKSNPGLGGYTSGTLYISKPTQFFVYIGTIGFFNALKSFTTIGSTYAAPGGATDVRLKYSEDWWDNYSLISRIMVAAGGGGAEWEASVGGNGGGIQGGSSVSAKLNIGSEVYEEQCPGATQTSGSSECQNFTISISGVATTCYPSYGSFGSAGTTQPVNGYDYGAFGGGGYYGGTSYQYAFAGSGGSSFISGHEGCDAVKDQSEVIEHTNQSVHYSHFVFWNTEMIPGNETMPLPESQSGKNIHNGEGAFRITLLMYQCQCTYKRSLYYSLIPTLFIIISFSINNS